MTRPSLALILALALMSSPAFAQVAVYPASKPGTYDMIDRAKIINKEIQWSKLQQQKDYDSYQKALTEMDVAYRNLYGTCKGDNYNFLNCTGLQRLRSIHYATIKTKTVQAVTIGDLQKAIQSYISMRDIFSQKLDVLSKLHTAWKKYADQKSGKSAAEVQVYRLGMMDLQELVEAYRQSITKMDGEAEGLTYRYDSTVGYVKTRPGAGLDVPEAEENDEYMAAELKRLQQNYVMTREQKDKVSMMNRELSRTMLEYTQANGKRLYWFNKLQKEDNAAWIQQVQKIAQVFKWTRAAGCMTIGVPALSIPEPRSFNLDYFKRGVTAAQVRLVDKTEYNANNIRTTLSRFDQLFTSIQSQAGEFNSEGGVGGFLNKANSKLTWHNEVRSWLNVLKILRENMVDELNLMATGGCDKVKASYKAAYGDLKLPAAQKMVNDYFGGMTLAGATDTGRSAIKEGGTVILSKIRIAQKIKKIQEENPGLVDDIFSDLE